LLRACHRSTSPLRQHVGCIDGLYDDARVIGRCVATAASDCECGPFEGRPASWHRFGSKFSRSGSTPLSRGHKPQYRWFSDSSGPDGRESCRRGGMADAEDLKSSGGNPVWVRFPPPVLHLRRYGDGLPGALGKNLVRLTACHWGGIARQASHMASPREQERQLLRPFEYQREQRLLMVRHVKSDRRQETLT
jgi:hypothetical protein